MRAFALRRQLLGGAFVVLGGAALACNDTTATDVPVPVAAVLTENSGVEAQSATVGTALPAPISVKLTESGQPTGGRVVSWKVESGGGSIDAATSTTDANGDAVVHWTLGTVAGPDTLIATTADSATSIITATAIAGPAAALKEVSGDAQDIAAGATPAPLVVKVVDQYGNVVPGATIAWSVTGGAAIDNTSTITDAGGLAQVTLTSIAAPGTFTVTASAAGVAPVMFTEREE